MSEANWLSSELERAKREVQSWDEWKRDAMRREATAISHVRETGDAKGSNLDAITKPSHSRDSVL